MSLANSEWNGSLYQPSTLIIEWRPLSSSLGFIFFSFFTNLAREPYSRLNSYHLGLEHVRNRSADSTVGAKFTILIPTYS
eukprot:scaffold194264_cov72-Attheya_sp.AAC.1